MELNKAPGPGNIPSILIKCAPDIFLQKLLILFKRCLVFEDKVSREENLAYSTVCSIWISECRSLGEAKNLLLPQGTNRGFGEYKFLGNIISRKENTSGIYKTDWLKDGDVYKCSIHSYGHRISNFVHNQL